MKMKSRRIPEVGLRNRWEIKESYELSPTQKEVDAYIRSLERQVWLKDLGMPRRHEKKQWVAKNGRGACVSSRFLGGLIALALSCFTWLLQIIYEAFK